MTTQHEGQSRQNENGVFAPRTIRSKSITPSDSEARLHALHERFASIQINQKVREREIAVAVYSEVSLLSRDVGARAKFYGTDFWKDAKRRPSVGGDDNIALHCARRVCGFGRENASRTTELGKVLSRALEKNLSAKQFEAALRRAGNVRNMYRNETPTTDDKTQRVGVSYVLRRELLKSQKLRVEFDHTKIRMMKTKTGVFLSCMVRMPSCYIEYVRQKRMRRNTR